MAEPPSEKDPKWPPKKEDLERLYLDERLSAAKIAKVYGLGYASPKTAESTVLYQLKKVGIKRRDVAEHARKVTPEIVDMWVKRYEAGESLKQIAEGKVSPATVFNHLKARGLVLRDKVEAQIRAVTKHAKSPFSGSEQEKMYMLGFAVGDCDVVNHGRAIRVRTGTTHPLMAELFDSIFGGYGRVHRYPRKSQWTAFEWSLEVDLDRTFEFLLLKGTTLGEIWSDSTRFRSFLGGFFDAEGSIYFHRKHIVGGDFEISITNTNGTLLGRIKTGLDSMGYHTHIKKKTQDPKRLGYDHPGEIDVLRILRGEEVRKFLGEIPFRHPEKIQKKELIRELTATRETKRRPGIDGWDRLLKRIDDNRKEFINKAKEEVGRENGHN